MRHIKLAFSALLAAILVAAALIIPSASALSAGGAVYPSAPGKTVYKNDRALIDASNASDGYVMVKFTGKTDKALKVIVACPSKAQYTYDLGSDGQYDTFVLSEGSGTYSIGVYENVTGTKYATVFSAAVAAKLADEFKPFLTSNQYVNFTEKSAAVALAKKLTTGKTDRLEQIGLIYDYVVTNIKYDKERAASVKSGYLPDVDEVLRNKKGICFDYAALMCAMLRSLGIPSKLVVGYTGTVYHAWINAYTDETGWIEKVIYFDGKTWKLMDPTFAASANRSDEIMKYIGNGSNYKQKYVY